MLPLIEALQTPCIATRVWAARLLGRMGPSASAALPSLERLSRAKSKVVRRAARDAIRQIELAETPEEPKGPFARFLAALRTALGAVHA